MKKFLAIMLTFVLAVSLFACGKTGSNETGTGDKEEEITGYYCEVNGKKVAPGGSVDKFLADLESVGVSFNDKTAIQSCMFAENGDDVTFHFDFGDVFTFPMVKDQPNVVDEINIFDESVLIYGKVRVGDTFDKLKAELGENFFVVEGDVVYNAENDPEKKDAIPKLVFYFEGDQISGASIVANLYHH